MKRYYLAYGSNLNLIEMKKRCPNARVIEKIILNDYRLVYKGSETNYAYLTIEKSLGDYVPLVLFKISKFDELSLDHYEGYPILYKKCYVSIKVGSKDINALLYIMNKDIDYNIPSISYINCCKIGYSLFEFDPLILDKALEYTKEKVRQKSLKK